MQAHCRLGHQHMNLGADTNFQPITPFHWYSLLLPLWIPSWATAAPQHSDSIPLWTSTWISPADRILDCFSSGRKGRFFSSVIFSSSSLPRSPFPYLASWNYHLTHKQNINSDLHLNMWFSYISFPYNSPTRGNRHTESYVHYVIKKYILTSLKCYHALCNTFGN